MNHNLGKLLLLLCSLSLNAEDFTYSIGLDKTNPYVKEAVVLTLKLEQTNPHKVLMFDFDLEASSDYTFQRIDMQESDNHQTKGMHAVHITYTYLVYPLHADKITLKFDLLKKETSDESVAYSYSGDRDNVKTLRTKDTVISLPPKMLSVKPLAEGTDLVGDFTLRYKIPKRKAISHEPLPFQVTIEGLGYPPLLSLLPKDVNFTVFTEQPLTRSTAGIKGIHSTINYPIALSHDANFTLPLLTFSAFNPKTEKHYTLKIPEQKFNIQKIAQHTLIDKTDTPKPLKDISFSWLYTLFTYVVVFFFGYLSAKSLAWHKRTVSSKNVTLKQKIKECKNEKKLLQLLMATDSKRFSKSIITLESSLYGDGKINLSKVKQEVMDTP